MSDKGFFATIVTMIVLVVLVTVGGIWASYHFGDHHTGVYSVVNTEKHWGSKGTTWCEYTLTDGTEKFETTGAGNPCEDIKHGTRVRVNDGDIDQDFWTGKLAKVN